MLVYHKICDSFEWGLTRVRPDVFETHVRYLAQNGFKTVGPTVGSSASERAPDNRQVCLFFDDAYENVFDHAFPVLTNYGFTATVAAVSGFTGAENSWDANLGGIRFRHMSAGQLRALSDAGWEIASHSRTHRALTGMDSESRKSEITRSKHELEDCVGVPVRFFVYPFGKFDRDCLETVIDSGYLGAAGFFQKYVDPKAAPFNRERKAVYRFDSIRRVNSKLNGNRLESARLRLINLGASATVLTQRFGRSRPEREPHFQ